MERDVSGNHVIPVKLAGELSQPLDSLRMGCGDSLFQLTKCIDAINVAINLCLYRSTMKKEGKVSIVLQATRQVVSY